MSILIIVMGMLLTIATIVYYTYNQKITGYAKSNINEVVASKDVELRTGPSESYPIIKTIKSSDSLNKKSESGDWIEVSTEDNNVGWIPGWSVVGSTIKSPEDKLKEQLKNYTVIINPIYTENTDDKSLVIATQIKQELEKSEIKTIISRNEAKTVDNSEISKLIVDNKANIVVNIGLSDISAPIIYYNNTSSKILSKYLEKTTYNNFILKTKTAEKKENVVKVTNENVPEVLLIAGNLNSKSDMDVLSNEIYRKQYAIAVKSGIEEYFYYLINLDNYNEKRKEQLINMPQKGMNIPFYYTKQDNFKNIDYGLDNNKKISDNGDAIISLAMIINYLDPNKNITVSNIVDWAGSKYYVIGQGTNNKIVSDFADKYNLKIESVNKTEIDKINEALKNSKPVLVQFNSGLFGNKMTYKIIRGFEDNKYYINDPDDDDLKLNNYTGFTKNDIERNMNKAWIFSK